jgi:hypothetical protein
MAIRAIPPNRKRKLEKNSKDRIPTDIRSKDMVVIAVPPNRSASSPDKGLTNKPIANNSANPPAANDGENPW